MAVVAGQNEAVERLRRAASPVLSAGQRSFSNFWRLAVGTAAGRIALPIVSIHIFVAIFGTLLAPYSATDFHLFPKYPKSHQLAGPALARDFIRVEAVQTPRKVDLAVSVSSEIRKDLDNGVISENLKNKLSDANETLELSDTATVSTVQEGSSWLISDLQKDTTLSVTKEATERYWLGTDQFGRDVLSRVLSGARSLIVMSLAGTIFGLFLGTAVGMTSGYRGGKIDEVVMRIMDGMMSFPSLLLALLVLTTLGAWDSPLDIIDDYWEHVLIVLTIGIAFMPRCARVMRSVTLRMKNLEFVMSARLRGETGTYIIFREILPNAMPVLGVEFSVRLSYAILLVSSLGFLGLGVQPPSPDWGLMIAEGRQFLVAAPHMVLVPAAAVASLVVAVNLLTDGIRQASGIPRDITNV